MALLVWQIPANSVWNQSYYRDLNKELESKTKTKTVHLYLQIKIKRLQPALSEETVNGQ